MALFGHLDTFVVGVNLAGSRGAGSRRQGAGGLTVAARQAAQQRRRRGQTRSPGSGLTRGQEGLYRIEGGAVDDRRNLIFDDLGWFLAFAIATAIVLIKGRSPV